MAEETEGQDTGTQAVTGVVNPAAVTLALGGASREEADNFLRNQNVLIADQRHHLHAQLRQIHLSIWKECLGVLLRVATAVVGIVVAAGFAFMVWDASQSNGLLIEPFSVPPDLAKNGLTGEVVAAKLLDRLVLMQTQTVSNRAYKSYANGWDEKGFKLDIPETGVSLAELESFLRGKLGHDTRVSGEIVRTASGLSLTARAGMDGGDSVSGSEEDLEILTQRSAENIYRMTQPYRYGYYLATHNRTSEAIPIFRALARSGPAQERPWGYYGWGSVLGDSQGNNFGIPLLKQTLVLAPNHILASMAIAQHEEDQSLPEHSIDQWKKSLLLFSSSSQEMIRSEPIPFLIKACQVQIDRQLGAFHEAAQKQTEVVQSGLSGRYGLSAFLVLLQAGEHDLVAARTSLANPSGTGGFLQGSPALYGIWARTLVAAEAQDWGGVLTEAKAIDPLLLKYPGLRLLTRTTIEPLIAIAEAKLGNFPAAEARISATPADCYVCLRTRARIAELKGEHARADYWFARAIAGQQSVPFAYHEWGVALMARGETDNAIAKFTVANQKGLHFADPLEGWGEALMAKNQSHLALEKFAEAEKYAPNWGRLHLKWGEALGYAGKTDEAKKQFALAATLDLTPGEKAELARQPLHA